jgi:hypothetical protein
MNREHIGLARSNSGLDRLALVLGPGCLADREESEHRTGFETFSGDGRDVCDDHRFEIRHCPELCESNCSLWENTVNSSGSVEVRSNFGDYEHRSIRHRCSVLALDKRRWWR